MKNLPKKQWKPSLPLKDVADIMISWCIRAREKNILRKKPPQIYYSYVIEGSIPLQYMVNVSQLFKYSQKDMPYIDQTRDSILRCLAIALKTHFFIFYNSNVSHEPYFFTFPNLADPNQTDYGIVYEIENENKTIIICEKNLNLLLDNVLDKSKVIYQFHSVLTENSFKWYHIKNWAKIKVESTITINNEKEIFDKNQPWLNKSLLDRAKKAETKEELLKYATIIDVPYELKDFIKPLGIEWSKQVNTWYIPLGFDKESIEEYILFLKK